MHTLMEEVNSRQTLGEVKRAQDIRTSIIYQCPNVEYHVFHIHYNYNWATDSFKTLKQPQLTQNQECSRKT